MNFLNVNFNKCIITPHLQQTSIQIKRADKNKNVILKTPKRSKNNHLDLKLILNLNHLYVKHVTFVSLATQTPFSFTRRKCYFNRFQVDQWA